MDASESASIYEIINPLHLMLITGVLEAFTMRRFFLMEVFWVGENIYLVLLGCAKISTSCRFRRHDSIQDIQACVLRRPYLGSRIDGMGKPIALLYEIFDTFVRTPSPTLPPTRPAITTSIPQPQHPHPPNHLLQPRPQSPPPHRSRTPPTRPRLRYLQTLRVLPTAFAPHFCRVMEVALDLLGW